MPLFTDLALCCIFLPLHYGKMNYSRCGSSSDAYACKSSSGGCCSIQFPTVGSTAPDFNITVVSTSGSFEVFSLKHEAENSDFVVLFFYPMAFTFVCPTELLDLSDNVHRFTEIKSKVLAISCDSVHSLLAWREREHSSGGVGDVQIPLASDMTRYVSKMYGSYSYEGHPTRSTFVLDKKMMVRYVEMIDSRVGRDTENLLNKIAALRFADEHGQVCPAGWKKGQSGMDANLSCVADYLTSNYKS